MRLLLKSFAFLAGAVALVLLGVFCWLYFYSRDLPDVKAVAQYAPTTVTQVSDPCVGTSIAIPYEAIGENLRNAIRTAEANENDPGALSDLFHGDFRDKPLHRASLPVVVSRSLFCSPSKMLKRHFDELRTGIQLDRHYSRQQLLTIFANRVYLGPNLRGIRQGAEFYFHKNPSELTVSEAALLVAIVKAPAVCSPSKHPDRALRRRNEVIDAMVESGTVTVVDAQAAKAAPLGVVASASTTAAQ